MRTSTAVWIAVILLAGTHQVRAAEGCTDFSWNVSRERALFAAQGQALTAGENVMTAPTIQINRLYRWTLWPQDRVVFALPPGKKARYDGARAGIARLRIDAPGLYRIALDQAFWVDVIADGKVIPSADFQGAPGCQAPHKIVAYELPAGKDLLLQVSGETASELRLTVTRAP